MLMSIISLTDFSQPRRGGGAGALVKAVCFENRRSRVRTPFWHSGIIKPHSFINSWPVWPTFRFFPTLDVDRPQETSPMLVFCWATVCDPALNQHWINVSWNKVLVQQSTASLHPIINTRFWVIAGLMLAHCLRSWPDINPTLVERLGSAAWPQQIRYIEPMFF